MLKNFNTCFLGCFGALEAIKTGKFFMLDTIHLHISNPVVNRQTGATRYHEFIEHVNKKAIDKNTRFSYKEQFSPGVSLQVVNGTFYDDSGTLYFHHENLKVKSSSSQLVFCANYNKERIEINVSVPKFIAGNNVYYMLDFADYHNFSKNASAVYKMIKFYARQILLELGDNNFHLRVEPEHVNVERIDLCYNVLCADQDEVKRRIIALNQLRKKRQAKAGNECTYGEHGDESFTVFSSLGWYFKAYNKHLEFKKNDYKKLVKINKDRADFVLQQSQKILRFEIGIRSNFMDYLFWNKLFWKDSVDKKLFDEYKYWRSKPPLKSAEKTSDNKRELTKEERLQNEKDYSKFKYLKSVFQPFTFKAMDFHLGEHNNNPVWYRNEFTDGFGFKWNTQLLNNKKSFDFLLVQECWNFFYSLLQDYNPDFKDVKKEMKNYKSQSMIDKLIVDYLKRGKTLDEAVKKFNISRATVYNVKKRFEKAGLNVTAKSIHQPGDFHREISLAPYFHFKAINNIFIFSAQDMEGDKFKTA